MPIHSKNAPHEPEEPQEGEDRPDQTSTENQSEDSKQEPGSSGSEAPAEPKPAEDYPAKISALEAEKAELNDKFLRKAAEFENYRKRMIKEKEDTRIYANTELLVDLVSLLDDFDRAIQSSEAGKDFKTLHDGISMIQKAFLAKLEGRYGLTRYDSQGQEFDPSRHEAVMAEQRDDIDHATVIDDFMKGYCLHDRVIRPAKVRVAMPSAQSAPAEAAEKANE
jgi:molecular chaperone GrpE